MSAEKELNYKNIEIGVLLKGTIKTYLPEKQYGFIKGDDEKDYFFHHSSFTNKNDIDKLCEGLYLEFDQKATPKGYSAFNIMLPENNTLIRYKTPDVFYTSKNTDIKGWEVVEYSNWIIHGSSRDSPDEAKYNMQDKAILIGANALLNIRYYKTTGSESGTGRGTHYYTIHNFKGVVANIAKKSIDGQYTLDNFNKLNDNAKMLKKFLVKKTESAKIKRAIFWLIILIFISTLWATKQNYAIAGSVGLIIAGLILSHATDYDWWLEEMK